MNEKGLEKQYFDDYLAIPYYSASKIQQYDKNPALYKSNFLKNYHQSDKDFSVSKTFGSVLHKSVLEQADFSKNEEIYLNLLTPKERGVFSECRANFLGHEQVKKILSKVDETEKTIVFKKKISKDSEDVDVWCKMRADIVTTNGWVSDVKTISSLKNIRRSLNEYRYDIQAAFYKEGAGAKGFVFIFVEKTKPFETAVFYAKGDLLDRGRYGNGRFRGYEELLPEMHFSPKATRFKVYQELGV